MLTLKGFFSGKMSRPVPQAVDAAVLVVMDILGAPDGDAPEGSLNELITTLIEAVVRGTFARHEKNGSPVTVDSLLDGFEFDGQHGLFAMAEEVRYGRITGPAADAISKSLRLCARHPKCPEDAGFLLMMFRKTLSDWRDGIPYRVQTSKKRA